MADKSIVLAAGWEKVNDNGFSYTSCRFTGNREDDKYEVVLRRKEDQAELLLSDNNCILIENSFKTDSEEDSKKPDVLLKVFMPEE